MRHLFAADILAACVCATLLAACTGQPSRSSVDSSSISAGFENTTPDVSESTASSQVSMASSRASAASEVTSSRGQSNVTSSDSSAEGAYSGEWISKGVTSLYDQGGYSLTLAIHTDGTASGSLGHASYHIGHEADADFTGTVRNHVVTATFRDDGWGHAGTLKMELSGGEIRLTVTLNDPNVTGWQLGGGEMPTTLVLNTASASSAR